MSATSSDIHVLSDPTQSLESFEGLGLALVGVDIGSLADSGEALERSLGLIAQLGQRSIPVICYGDDASTWSLQDRCRILLAGAPTLLDSSGFDFEEQLVADVHTRADAASSVHLAVRRVGIVSAELGIVGQSLALKNVMLAVERSARLSDMPVLLLGESGTGKDLLAHAVHRLDPRRFRHPFVPVNCAALTHTLAEAELFGHRKGVFSGADRERPGLVRAADGGVLFLDEIGDLDLDLQAKLLRVIQERRVLVLGDTHESPVDVRIVAATHRDLGMMVRQQRFRADLLNRLWVYPIDIPPLRRRREDIPSLVDFFLTRHAGPDGARSSAGFDFLEALQLVELEGNVRQVTNLVQRAVAIAGFDRLLCLGDLPPELWAELARLDAGSPRCIATATSPLRTDLSTDLNLFRSLERHERTLVEGALRVSGGNQTRAAIALGITARSLYNKLRKHKLVSKNLTASSPV